MNLSNIGVIKDLLNRYGFTFSKQLGQNFLVNPSVCPRMADICLEDISGCTGVLEIGPGIGVLTKELGRVSDKVVAVELDKRLSPVLDAALGECENVEIIYGDILKLDLAEILSTYFDGMNVVVCANLPYYITSPVIMKLLESGLPFASITVMVQKEAAQRLCAKVGTRQCGAVTVAVNYYAEAQKMFDVSRGSFLPAPNVDSSVIKLTVRSEPLVDVCEKFFFKTVKAAFSQRRKTLVNALSSGLAMPKEEVIAAVENAGLKPTARAEELSMDDFAKLSNLLY